MFHSTFVSTNSACSSWATSVKSAVTMTLQSLWKMLSVHATSSVGLLQSQTLAYRFNSGAYFGKNQEETPATFKRASRTVSTALLTWTVALSKTKKSLLHNLPCWSAAITNFKNVNYMFVSDYSEAKTGLFLLSKHIKHYTVFLLWQNGLSLILITKNRNGQFNYRYKVSINLKINYFCILIYNI